MTESVRVERMHAMPAALLNRVNVRFPDHQWEATNAARFCEDATNVLLLAYRGDTLCGLLIAYRLQCLDGRRAQLFIDEVDVHEDSWRRGVGRAMLASIMQIAREMDAGEVWVQTHASNAPAVGLYRAVGGVPEDSDETIVSFAFEISHS
ncbi:MAG: GNAT family N-acetyltransferase [Chloroflexota bacterium]|nr:GNAT family N-acetyltransferase [Chloroflexota bacterium]